MQTFYKICLLLLIVGGVNWGLVGLFQFDLVGWLLGGSTSVWSRIVFALVLLVAYLGAVLLGEVWRTAMRAHAAAPGSSGGESACECEAVDVLEGGD